jgi:hypothetical protein
VVVIAGLVAVAAVIVGPVAAAADADRSLMESNEMRKN